MQIILSIFNKKLLFVFKVFGFDKCTSSQDLRSNLMIRCAFIKINYFYLKVQLCKCIT